MTNYRQPLTAAQKENFRKKTGNYFPRLLDIYQDINCAPIPDYPYGFQVEAVFAEQLGGEEENAVKKIIHEAFGTGLFSMSHEDFPKDQEMKNGLHYYRYFFG